MNDHGTGRPVLAQPASQEFLTSERPKPDELWVIRRATDLLQRPDRAGGKRECRSELPNVSPNQELHFIESVNDWVRAGYLPDEY